MQKERSAIALANYADRYSVSFKFHAEVCRKYAEHYLIPIAGHEFKFDSNNAGVIEISDGYLDDLEEILECVALSYREKGGNFNRKKSLTNRLVAHECLKSVSCSGSFFIVAKKDRDIIGVINGYITNDRLMRLSEKAEAYFWVYEWACRESAPKIVPWLLMSRLLDAYVEMCNVAGHLMPIRAKTEAGTSWRFCDVISRALSKKLRVSDSFKYEEEPCIGSHNQVLSVGIPPTMDIKIWRSAY